MKKTLILSAAALSLVLAAPAAAAITFKVEGTFWWPDVTLDGAIGGTFTTNDALTEVTALDLMTTSNGGFQAFAYDDPADIDMQALPGYFRLTVPVVGGLTNQLQLWFTADLTNTPGADFAFTGFEHQEHDGSGNRMLTGAATILDPLAVPEPGTWALLIAGFGLTGAALRRRPAAVHRVSHSRP